MNFKTHNINQRSPRKKPNVKKILLIIVVAYLFFFIIPRLFGSDSIKEIIFSFGKDLGTDQNGKTNILLIGTGGEGHDGPDLTDTLILASIDEKNNLVSMLSIPRDLYVENKDLGGGSRINDVYSIAKNKYSSSEKGLETLRKTTETVTGIDIQYYVKINFNGFKDIVDSLGGLDVDVEKTLDDPLYPKAETTYYEPFFLEKGLHHLNGETALKYVRSRHTPGESDFDRSRRQQKFIFAIKERAFQKEILTNPGKIKDLFGAVSNNVETNLSLQEIITMADLSTKISSNNLASYLIHDDPSQCGGFLYTPDTALYGGAFVLVPAAGNFSDLQQFAGMLFKYPEFFKNKPKIQVLNTTKTIGLATRTMVILQRNCMDVTRYGNGKAINAPKTTYYIKTPEKKNFLLVIEQLFKGSASEQIPPDYLTPAYASDADIIMELGTTHTVTDPFDAIVELKKEEEKSDTESTTTEEPAKTITQ